MQQGQQEQPQEKDEGGSTQVEVEVVLVRRRSNDPGQQGAHHMDDFRQTLQRQKGAAEGQQKKTRQEASDPSPEAQGAQMLQPAQVDFAAVVDAIQDDVQPVVGLQQGIAAEQFFPGA